MPGQGGLHGDTSSLDVADLANQDDVGILPQDGAQARGESESGLLVRLDLVDAGEDVLDRILDRHDVTSRVADLRERRVQRGGLAAPGRTCAQHHAERCPGEVGVGLGRIGGHAELGEAHHRARAVQQPHDALLTPDGGQGGDPDVDLAPVDLSAQLTVLGTPPLDDVHAGHDLDPADQTHAHGGGESEDLLERAVDAVAHPDAYLAGLDVDV